MPSSFFKSLVCLLLTAWIACAARAAVTPYFVTDLGSLGGDSTAYAINNHGQVVGTSGGKAFIWDSLNGMRELQGLGGDYTYAYAINDAGTAVGGAWTADNAIHATMWASQLTPTDIAPGPSQTSIAYGINAGGTTIIQAVADGSNQTRMVIRGPSGQMTDHGTLSGSNAIAWAINNAGTVALQWDAYGLPQGNPQIWIAAYQLMFLTKPDGATSSALYALSNVETGVGATYLPDAQGNWRAIFWEVNPIRSFPGYWLGITTVLPTLGGATLAWGMNDLNQIVGTSSIDPYGTADLMMRAFLYDHETLTMYDLNTLLVPGTGWMLLGAQDVNEDGQIVGWGVNPEGKRHAFMLTPVPEPGTAGLLLAGLSAVILRRRRVEASPFVAVDRQHSCGRPMTGRCPSRGGYTLMELVVTASITTVTFTLLMPGIGQVRQSSAMTGCQGNTKFLCDMALHYAAEHQNITVPDERRPAYRVSSNGQVMPASDYGWEVINIKTEADRRLSWLGVLEDKGYLPPENLGRLICPVIPNVHRRQTSYDREKNIYYWPTDYVLNSFGLNASTEMAEEPARNVMVAEPNMDRGAVNYMVMSIEPGTFGLGRNDLEQHRVGSLSFGFVDGHAARVRIPDGGGTITERAKIILLGSYPELALSLGSPPKSLSSAYSNVMWWHRGNVRGTGSDRELTTLRQQPPNNLTAPRTLPPG